MRNLLLPQTRDLSTPAKHLVILQQAEGEASYKIKL